MNIIVQRNLLEVKKSKKQLLQLNNLKFQQKLHFFLQSQTFQVVFTSFS